MYARFLTSIHKLSPETWNQLCGQDYPFLRHEFFAALEDSGSTSKKTGWEPYHLIVEQDGEALLAMPLFLKYHSYGEYVFDWSWADAWHRGGKKYYPKLLNAIPFTPATGPRWGLADKLSETQKQEILNTAFDAIETEGKHLQLSSSHWLFTSEQNNHQLEQRNYLKRIGYQYHFNFEDKY